MNDTQTVQIFMNELLHNTLTPKVIAFYFYYTTKKILTACPLENWRRPPGRPRTTWMKTIYQDLRSNNLSLDEATDVALETDVYVCRYALLVVHATREDTTMDCCRWQ